MSSGTLTRKRILRSLEERYAAGKLNVNALDKNGLSLVHQFSYDGQLAGLQWALQHEGDLLARSSEGCVAAHYAAASGHLHVLQYLQEHTAQSIDIKDHNGTCPLYIAAQEGQSDCVMWLTKYSSVPASEASHDGMTAVHASAQEGHLDCVRYLVQFARCSATKMDHTGCTPLHFASAEGHWKVVRWLLERMEVQGDEVDATGTAAIHLAAEYNQLKVLKVFVKLRNALVMQKNGNGRSPLDICMEKDYEQCSDFLKGWQMQGSSAETSMKHRSSLKKVRFDEDNGQSSPANDHPSQGFYNNNDYTIDNGYLIMPGGRSEAELRERLRRNREEWERSNVIDIDFEEKMSSGAGEKEKKTESVGGSRNVRKRRSFKDKNAKYRARVKEQNRGSIGHMLDKLHLRKGLNQSRGLSASLPYRAGERGSRPDLIQSVLDADKNAAREFVRRPSLEFFQDLSSQLSSGSKREAKHKLPQTDIPVTIFHNGALRASRDNLNDGESFDSQKYESSESKNVTEAAQKAIEIKTKSPARTPNDIPVSRVDDDSAYRVVIDGAGRRKKMVGNGDEKESSRAFEDAKTHEPHPQRKIKLPKGFTGILPKHKLQELKIDKESNGTMKLEKTRKGFLKTKKKETIGGHVDANQSLMNNVLPDDVSKEHYLIRSLPLPSHGSHVYTRSDNTMFFSNNLISDSKQTFGKWSSVRQTVGSFFSSLRSVKKRDKVYKVHSVQNVSSLYDSNDSLYERKDNGKFNLIKSLQLKPKKRKSLSLDHLPFYASSGEAIQVSNGNQSSKKRLSALQPGYAKPDLSQITSMAMDQTLKGRVDSVDPVDDDRIPPPEPEESLDYVVSNKQTTGFELESLQVNTALDGMETGKALMW